MWILFWLVLILIKIALRHGRSYRLRCLKNIDGFGQNNSAEAFKAAADRLKV